VDNISNFCFSLRKRKNTHLVFNPYRDPTLVANLEVYLRGVKRCKGGSILLVGEAPGYRGCKNTGIPFSSSHLFTESKHPLIELLKGQLIFKIRESEVTAGIVWDYLTETSVLPIFWNAFPFHPHISRKYNSNRPPTQPEILEGTAYLNDIASIFQPGLIAGIGRAGQQCAQLAFPNRDISYIRHPSRGGKKAFIQGMNRLLCEDPMS
jgi:uracil-DNA glycosylase